MSGKIVMIGSMKGGVSKTVTTFNLRMRSSLVRLLITEPHSKR